MDSVAGGSSADSIYGSLTGTNDTFNAYDAINGGGGTDTLSITLGADYDGGGNISNIENFALKATAAKYFDFNGIDGVASINSDRSTNVLTAKNIASTTTQVGFNVVTNTAADLVATFTDSALNGTNDTVTVNLTGGVGSSASTAADNQILVSSTASTNGAENLTINVTGGDAYIGKIESEEGSGNSQILKKVTVTGSGALEIFTALDFTGTTTATFDASAATGGVTVGLDVNVTKMSATGGTGDDSFDMSTGLNSTDTIDGGAGTDTVKAVGANGAATTFTLTDLAMSNIEVFQAQSDTGDALVLATEGQAGLTKVVLVENVTTGTDMTVTDLAAGVAVDIIENVDAQATGAVTLGLLDASGTADTLTVTLKGTATHLAADNTLASLTVSNIETLALVSSHDGSTVLGATDTNTITSLVSDTTLTKITASGSDALSVTLSGAETKLAAIDASAMTDVITISVANLTSDVSITTGSQDDSIVFGATLNNKDTVAGGTNSTDSTNEDILTATITSLTATTGALNVTGVERLNLTNGGTATINAAGIVGATEIAIITNTTKTTITGLAAGTAVGLGQKDTDGTADGTLVLSLADATGTADALTINLNDTDGTQTTTAILQATAIETVTVNVNSTTDAAMADSSLTVSALNASKLVVTGSKGDVGNTMTVGTLDTDTKTLDASGYYGILTATAGAATGTAMTVKGGAIHNLTGSSGNDTIVVTGTANAAYTINGNGGTDTLTIDAAAGALDLDGVSDVDTVTLNVAASAAVTLGVDANTSDGLNAATTVKITGGNSLSTVTIGVTPVGTFAAAHATVNSDGSFGGLTGATTTLFDASGFSGKMTNVVFTANGLDDSVTVIGTANSGDKVTAIYAASQTIKSMTGVETLEINATGTVAIDMKNVDGVTKVMLDDDGTARVVTLTDLDTGVSIEVEHGVTASGVVIDLIDSTSTADAVTVDIKTTASAADTYTIDSAASNDIETLNLVMTASSSIDLNGFTIATASKYSTVNVTGAGNLTLTAIDGDIRTINGSEMTGALVMSVTGSTSAKTLSSGSGADTLYMANAADVIDGGSGTTDTLYVVQDAILGGFAVDLTSTVDQITTYNGSANTAVQKGFENVVLTSITGVFGADITANSAGSTIAGTLNADVITLGAGTDTVVAWDSTTDSVNSFTYGASGDQIDIDISALETAEAVATGVTLDFILADSAVSITNDGTDAFAVAEISADNTAVTAGADLYVLVGATYTNVAAAVDALELGGARTLTGVAASAGGDGILIAWSDGTDAYVSIAYAAAGDWDDTSADGVINNAELAGVNLAKLVGNAAITASEFNSANFDWIA